MRTRRTGIVALVVLLVFGSCGGVKAQRNAWIPLQAFNEKGFRNAMNGQFAVKPHIVYFNVVDAWSEYIGLGVFRTRGPRTEIEMDKPAKEFYEQNAMWRGRGYYPICVTGYLKDKVPHFGAIWVQDRNFTPYAVFIEQTPKQLHEILNGGFKKNHSLAKIIVGYDDGKGSYRFAILRVPAGKADWYGKPDLTEAEYEKELADGKSRGYRPMSVTAYPTPSGVRYTIVSIKDGRECQPKHKRTSNEHIEDLFQMRKAGFIPVSITGYMDETLTRPEVNNKAMGQFMAERQITAGTFAISLKGKIIYSGGLSLADAAGPRSLDPDTPMRLSGVTMAITAAAIHKLIEDGKLTLDTKAFPFLDLKPPPGQKPDPRLDDITIRHLLEHKGGWDQTKAFDPMLRPLEIAADLKVPAPPGAVDIIRYMIGQPLQFDPGSRTCTSNFGYCVLGRVIEKASRQTYLAYVQNHIFAPLRCRSVALARSLPRHRKPQEPRYFDPGKGRNVLDPQSKEEVPAPDGTQYLEAMDSISGLIASSGDMARFLQAYWISGERRVGPIRPGEFFGYQPGSSSMLMQLANGVNIAVLFNRQTDLSGPDKTRIRDMMQAIVDRQSAGALRYDTVWVKNE